MSQNTAKNKNYNNDRSAKIITSPDGTEIQITAGRKLRAIRSFARDTNITDAQFRALVCIVDRLNEGQGDEKRWGSAYPKFETLAQDIAKDERAAKRIVKELETGQRQTRSGRVTTLVPCKSVLTVQRSKDEDERNNVNLYRLKEWGAFAINQSGEGAVICKEGGGHLQEGVRSPVREGAVTAPDSTHLLTSKTHLTDPPQLAPACGEGGPAAVQIEEFDEIKLPEDHHSMSQRERFEFSKSAYEAGASVRLRCDDEGAWENFREIERLKRASFSDLIKGINEDRQFSSLSMPFSDHLAGWLWDEDDGLVRGPDQQWRSIFADVNGEPCEADAPF